MNNFYIAKRQLRLAGILDLFGTVVWATLIFIISCYHFLYLVPANANGTRYSSLITGGEVGEGKKPETFNPGSAFSSTFISEKGYSEFFNVVLIDFAIFKFTLWGLVLILFIFAVLSFIGKVVFGTISLYWFFRAKSVQHIYSSLAVIFFPIAGGIIAINTYKATTNRLAPKYIASNSALRQKLRRMWNAFARNNALEQTSNI